jgi:hypothetical protein
MHSTNEGANTQRVAAFKQQVRLEQLRDRRALELRLAKEELDRDAIPVTDESLQERVRLMRSINLQD